MKENNTDNTIKEKNLAYGGQALIEGVLMRGKEGYAFTVKKPDDTFYKEKTNYVTLGKRIKFLGWPFIRGIVGFFESIVIGIKVLNKSASLAFPEENEKEMSNVSMFFIFLISLLLALVVFTGFPYFLTSLFPVNYNDNPFSYNLIAGIIRMIMFFIYLFAISFINDTKRLFGYHGAEHKTIHTYEAKKDLSVENVKSSSRLHPRCGTSFIFIVFLITIVIFPLFNIYFNTQIWYTSIKQYGMLGTVLQRLIHIASHIFIGMPIVASISYELLKLSQKFEKNPLVKILISPGLFFQLFTTREPDETMIKAAILSLKMVLGNEKPDLKRNINDNVNMKFNLSTTLLIFPILFFL